MSVTKLPSLLKWAGGKEQELKYILPLLPPFERYYEPFLGGGAVFFSIAAPTKFINDRSGELVQFYSMVAAQDADFFRTLDLLAQGWQGLSDLAEAHATELLAIYSAFSRRYCERAELEQRLQAFVQKYQRVFCAMFAQICERNSANFLGELQRNLLHKTQRMRKIELQKWPLPAEDILPNLECALKSAFYMHLRHLYNHFATYEISPGMASAIFFFVRENAYASMFRYNRQGKFNVPYGGISYNRKDLTRKIRQLRSHDLLNHLHNTVIASLDFEIFLERYPPQSGDFLFLDPPYDSDFSTYMGNEFSQRDQQRLADYLLKHCPAKFMLVIKNTPLIQTLYSQQGLRIQAFEKKYRVSFQDRNNRDAEHLIVMNY